MISRKINRPSKQRILILGPRGTGKTKFVQQQLAPEIYINLLDDQIYQALLTNPQRLRNFIPTDSSSWIVIDDIPEIPALWDEVQKLIQEKKHLFVLTGSHARKIKTLPTQINRTYPLTAFELQNQFNLQKALTTGLLPQAYYAADAAAYLASYISSYLKEEIQQEGLVRDLAAFARFLEAACNFQARVLNQTQVALESKVERKTVANFFQILEDLLLSYQLEVFSVQPKRALAKHKKFYFFDVGFYRQLSARGPNDIDLEARAATTETLVLQELLARNEYQGWNYTFNCWHTKTHLEVDFVLSGDRGLIGIDVKDSERIKDSDLKALVAFKTDYPLAKTYLVYTGAEKKFQKGVQLIPMTEFLLNTDKWV